jgi:hypothetical protein
MPGSDWCLKRYGMYSNLHGSALPAGATHCWFGPGSLEILDATEYWVCSACASQKLRAYGFFRHTFDELVCRNCNTEREPVTHMVCTRTVGREVCGHVSRVGEEFCVNGRCRRWFWQGSQNGVKEIYTLKHILLIANKDEAALCYCTRCKNRGLTGPQCYDPPHGCTGTFLTDGLTYTEVHE